MIHVPSIDFIFRKRDFRFQKNAKNQIQIWDMIRKKYVVYSPEENVRQHIVHSLVYEYKIPQSWISVERSVLYNGIKKRYDILVYKNAEKPFLIIECKSPEIDLNENTVLQLSVYHHQLPSEYLMISNGSSTCLAQIGRNGMAWMSAWNIDVL